MKRTKERVMKIEKIERDHNSIMYFLRTTPNSISAMHMNNASKTSQYERNKMVLLVNKIRRLSLYKMSCMPFER